MQFWIKWFIDKDKIKEYTKLVTDEVIPFWRKQEGFMEIRAYRYPGTTMAITDMRFKTYMHWGKAMDAYVKSGLPEKFAMHTHGMEFDLFDNSPVIPDPLPPL